MLTAIHCLLYLLFTSTLGCRSLSSSLSVRFLCIFQVTVSGQLVFGTLLHRTVQLKLVTSGSLHEPVVDIGDQRSSVSYVTDPSVVKAVKIRWKGEEAWSSDISISLARVGMGHLTKVHITLLLLLHIKCSH